MTNEIAWTNDLFFRKWYEHQLESDHHDGILDPVQAYEHYLTQYPCTCESCSYRKEHGMLPVKLREECIM